MLWSEQPRGLSALQKAVSCRGNGRDYMDICKCVCAWEWQRANGWWLLALSTWCREIFGQCDRRIFGRSCWTIPCAAPGLTAQGACDRANVASTIHFFKRSLLAV